MIDKIQERYGWTDSAIQDLYYDRFFEIIEAIGKAEKKEFEMDTFQTWQIVSCQMSKPISFKDYIKQFVKEDVKPSEKGEGKRILEDLEKVLAKKRGE